MKNVFRLFALVLMAIALLSIPAFGQSALATTTLSVAITTPNPLVSPFTLGNVVCLASVSATPFTNFVADSSPVKIYMDHEAMDVVSVNTTSKCVVVVRGTDGTAATPHNASITVFIATPQYFTATDLYGGCTRSNFAYLPLINLVSGNLRDCVNSQWVYNAYPIAGPSDQQINYTNPFGGFQTPYPAPGVSLTAVTDVATTVWFDQIFVQANATLTGACVLNGSGAGTDSVILYLWDQTGALVANTALAGTASANASAYQCIAFTATVNVFGPQTYFVGVAGNGTTASSFQMYPANSTPKIYGANSKTGVTFGTATTITPTTTFTAGKGPLMTVY